MTVIIINLFVIVFAVFNESVFDSSFIFYLKKQQNYVVPNVLMYIFFLPYSITRTFLILSADDAHWWYFSPETLFCTFSFHKRAYGFVVPLADCEASPGSDSEVMPERSSCSLGSPADLNPAASMDEIQVELQCADLWKRFHDIGTEMIITKAGRYNNRSKLSSIMLLQE